MPGGPKTGEIVQGFIAGTTQAAPDYQLGDEVVVEI